jgi:hypothetical protein
VAALCRRQELAAASTCCSLEAGDAFAHSERDWSHQPSEANNPATGIFRFGPGDRTLAPWARDLPQNSFVWQTAGVGGSTVHYFGNSPRAMPGVFSDYAGADAAAYDRDHAVPFGYRELIPYYEWVEHTLPVQTAAMGTKEEVSACCRESRLDYPDVEGHQRGILPTAGERDPPTGRNSGSHG